MRAPPDPIAALMALFPPHDLAHGRLEGLNPEGDKIQWTEHRAAARADYAEHLTRDQTAAPFGIGMFPLVRGSASWLCVDIDESGEAARLAALDAQEWLEARGIPAYLEISPRGRFHLFVFAASPAPGAIMVRAGAAIRTRIVNRGVVDGESYPTSANGGERAGRWVNLPYRGALLDADGYGASSLTRDGVRIPLAELGDVDRAPLAALEGVADLCPPPPQHQPIAPPANPEEAERIWTGLLESVRGVKPTFRHECLLACAAIGLRSGIEPERIERDLIALREPWKLSRGRDWNGEVERAVFATQARIERGEATSGWPTLSRNGVELPKLPDAPGFAVRVSTAEPAADGGKAKAGRRRELTLAEKRDIYLDHLAETGERYAYHEPSGTWWGWRGGVYRPVSEPAMMRRLDVVLERAGEVDLGEPQIRNVLFKLRHVAGIHRARFDLGAYELNTRNGYLDLRTLDLRDHSPDVFAVAQAGAEWHADAEAPVFRAYLERAVPAEADRRALAQFAGLALTGETRYQRALYILGAAGTGKGVFTRVLERLLGSADREGAHNPGYAASMALGDLTDGTPHLELLLGKRLLTISEVERQPKEWLTFKRATGEDTVRINPKYRQTYNMRLECKILLVSNNILTLGEDSANASVTRRMLPVEFNVPVAAHERDGALEAKLASRDEQAGILRWAVDGLQDLLKSGDFATTTSGATAAMVEHSNRAITFLEDRAEPAPGHVVRSSELYHAYAEWARESGHYAVNAARFATDVIAAADHLESQRAEGSPPWRIERGRDAAGRYFRGVRLIAAGAASVRAA